MSLIETILFGSLSSLIATIIWVIVVYLVDFSARKKIFFLLEECDPSARMLLNSVQYHSYMIALTQVEKITSILIQIYENLKLFNFSTKKRKFMKLIIFNLLRVLNIFKTLEEGYHEKDELNARCDKYDRKYLYKIKTNDNESECFMIISIMLLQDLNKMVGIKKPVLKTLKYLCRDEVFYENVMDSLIEVNSFKDGFTIDYFMNKEVLLQKEYKKMVKTILR